MSESVLIFTFSPIQSFIREARRTTDLYAGSRMLAELAAAALEAIAAADGAVVYPVATRSGEQPDTPNKLVAIVPRERAMDIGRAAEEALQCRWSQIAEDARSNMLAYGLPGGGDAVWEAIWQRQTAPGYLWQCFWAASEIGSDGYKQAYERASRALDAVKRSRLFPAAEERGTKDSLSGQREALHRRKEKARDYWRQVSRLRRVTGAMLRRDGRERLDAIGAIKRFWPQRQSFPSTSSIACMPFLEAARKRAPAQLEAYRSALARSLGRWLYEPRANPGWPYDGDLLFEETLTAERLEASYRAKVEAAMLAPAREALKKLYKAVGSRPSPYYAVIVCDGDSMGERISKLLEEDYPQEAHRQFGQKLSEYSRQVKDAEGRDYARVVYNGGDDVLALTPACAAISFAHELAQMFHRITGATASAGIALAHHLSPLDAVLAQARRAEREAKNVDGKDAVCVTLMRRGGEHTTARGRWASVVDPLTEVLGYLAEGRLSSRFPYDVASTAYSIPEPGPMLQAELKRILARRSEGRLGEEQAKMLNRWAENVPGKAAELARWLIIARFLSNEGGNEHGALS